MSPEKNERETTFKAASDDEPLPRIRHRLATSKPEG